MTAGIMLGMARQLQFQSARAELGGSIGIYDRARGRVSAPPAAEIGGRVSTRHHAAATNLLGVRLCGMGCQPTELLWCAGDDDRGRGADAAANAGGSMVMRLDGLRFAHKEVLMSATSCGDVLRAVKAAK
jgi:hypothetical protein